MTPEPNKIIEDMENEIRRNMESILKSYEFHNTINIKLLKELNNLRYLMEIKKMKTSKESPEDNMKHFEKIQKMYLYKLNQKQILSPRESTLNHYKIKYVNNEYIIE